jgi:outer membrane protein TolC
MALALLALCLLVQAAGCARPCVVQSGGWSPGVAPIGPAEALLGEAAERGTMNVDVSRVPSSADLDAAAVPEAAPYVALSAEQAQCLAAANAPLANLGALDIPLASVLPSGRRANCDAAAVKSDLLALRALDERNRAAGTALEMYYQLFEAEAGADALERSLAQLDEIIADVESLRAKGLKVPVDVNQLHIRRIELLDKQAEVRLALAKLNSGLRASLGVPAGDTRRFWPGDELTVDPQPIDVELAIAEGLATRPDLALVRMLAGTLSADTLPAVQSALQAAGMLSESGGMRRLWAPLARLFGSSRTSLELSTRAQQLQLLAVDSERAAAEEIRSAAHTVETRLRQTALAKETVESERLRLETLEKKRTLGEATPSEVLEARMSVIDAEHELVRTVTVWHIARAKLKQSQGLLAAECGGFPGCPR